MTEIIRTGTGLIHLYSGDGKGKTTTGMGLCVRAAGYGYKVLIYQFMKNNSTSERSAMKHIPGITFVDGLEHEKFSFLLTPQEKEERRAFYNRQLEKVTELARRENYDVLFLDEAVYAIVAGLLDEDALLAFLRTKPDQLEVILTGQNPGPRLCAICDYHSEIRKLKHPFDHNQPARPGIER